MRDLKFPLSNIQAELLKLYSTNLSDKDMADLKDILSSFYAEKAINKADDVWEKKGYTNEDMDHLLHQKS